MTEKARRERNARTHADGNPRLRLSVGFENGLEIVITFDVLCAENGVPPEEVASLFDKAYEMLGKRSPREKVAPLVFKIIDILQQYFP